MFQRFPNSLLLFRRALGLLGILRLGLVVARPLGDPALLLDLGDVQGSDIQAGLLLDVVFDGLVGGLDLRRSSVQIVQLDAELDMIVRVSLGKENYRLNMAREDRKYVICRTVRPT